MELLLTPRPSTQRPSDLGLSLFLAGLLVLFLAPFPGNAQDLQTPFTQCGVQGSITVFDPQKNQWTFSDPDDAERASLPASTFKILNSLIALQEKAVRDEHEVLKWDWQVPGVPAWNADTDLQAAFPNSTVWFYVRLAERIGMKKYQRYLKRVGYGNGKTTNAAGADFWNYGDFALSPKEQIAFLRRFYEGNLPFAPENIQKVKQLMVAEQTPHYTLSGKTGLTTYGGTRSGWYVGYVETKGKVYYFATRLHQDAKAKNDHFSACRKTITQQVLQALSILPTS
ncbi:penicillin-binding transpeptidase domain-containing protein [Rufibacter glacialis]|uniref:Beta-lactamase n=1 Tax=Rufibacter glacialis TaxID=1259555 RepID=A0A5M8QQR9_9BACT|nr:class D beta-lactamase [Rufibacter glacialis]KAA6437390.1 class D beta-lactamase [Rufibacter glacialis]GGK59669.1 beta-lactamase [Rufibacter glacialis]